MVFSSNLKFYAASRIPNLRGKIPFDFESNALTTRPSQLQVYGRFDRLAIWTLGVELCFYNINVSAASKHRTYRERSPLISSIVFLNQTFFSTIFN